MRVSREVGKLAIDYFLDLDFHALDSAIVIACFCFAFAFGIPSFLAIVLIALARVFHGFSFISFEMFLETVFWDFHLESGIVLI